MSESLSILVKNWMNLEEQIKELSITMKELRNNKNDMNDRIIEEMNANDVDMCNLGNSHALVLKNQVRFSSIKKELIEDTLKEVFKSKKKPDDPEKFATETTEAILNGRETNEVQVLRKIKVKK